MPHSDFWNVGSWQPEESHDERIAVIAGLDPLIQSDFRLGLDKKKILQCQVILAECFPFLPAFNN